MARSLEVVTAELAEAEARGDKGGKIKAGKLRKELIPLLGAENALLRTANSAHTVTVPSGAGLDADFGFGDVLSPDPLSTDEWAFIQKACGELELDLTKGVTTDLVKKIYNQIVAKVVAWRTMREIMGEIGPGGQWPQWSALNRSASTGEKLAPVAASFPVEPETDAQVPDPTITEGGMPVHAAAPADQDIKDFIMGGSAAPEEEAKHPASEAIAAGVLGDIANRPEPVREHATAE